MLFHMLVPPIRSVFRICCKGLSTWSPLGASFNALPGKKLNLNLLKEDVGLFGIPELTAHEGFYALKDRAVADTDRLIAESCSPSRQRKMVDIFDDLSDTLCRVADMAEFIRVAHPRSSFATAAEDACITISGVVEKLNTNKELYNALKSVILDGDKFPSTAVDQHVSKLFLFDFEQSGIHLEENQRQRVVQLNESILTVGQHFMAGSSNQRAVPKDTLPSDLAHYFTVSNNNIIVNGLFSESPIEAAREAAYKIYLHPDKHQEYLLDTLLSTRHELAVTCGFPTYAHRAVKGCTAETPDFISRFISKLNQELKPRTLKDYEMMLKFKCSENSSATHVQLWDVGYITKNIHTHFLKKNTDELSDYLCLGACMEGLNNLFHSLFGISLNCETVPAREVWAPDIYKLAVVHDTEGLLGHIYCDFYHRPGKPNQDCHFTIQGGRELPDGSYQNPIVVIMLNLPVPRWSSPSLLSPSQLDNLAHEMGHALHSMLARTKHQHVTGTRCATDFAEVPSILMEYFVSDPRVLKTFTKHFQTGKPMPESMLNNLCTSKHLLNAYETQTQLLYSAIDQKLHGQHPLNDSTTNIFYELQQEYSVLPAVKGSAWQLRFSHLVGYGAKYYSYLLSRSIASCIWQKYFIQDPFSREMGEKYRLECLRHGGGIPPRKLLTDFLNQETSPENMAESLITDIDKCQKLVYST